MEDKEILLALYTQNQNSQIKKYAREQLSNYYQSFIELYEKSNLKSIAPSKGKFQELEQEFYQSLQYCEIISCTNNYYPCGLLRLTDFPLILYYQGNISYPLNYYNCISIVGTRSANYEGITNTKEITNYLTQKKVTIVSGLAYGIDEMAHQQCLKSYDNNSKNLSTIAVLANGLDTIYPSSNEALAKKIIDNNGLIISEYPPKTIIKKYYFLARNRIISALSDSLIIIQATEKSGTLTTARISGELGLNVYAIPGSIKQNQYQGCNRLIKEGATPLLKVEDIDLSKHYENYPLLSSLSKSEQNQNEINELSNSILNKLYQKGTISIDELKKEFNDYTVAEQLMDLELEGSIEYLNNNLITLKVKKQQSIF